MVLIRATVNPVPEIQSGDHPINQVPSAPPMNTNGGDPSNAIVADIDSGSGAGADKVNPDGVLLYPNGKPVYGPDGNMQDMF